MNIFKKILLFILLITLSFSLDAQKVFNKYDVDPKPVKEVLKSVFLIGDAGEDPENQDGLLIMKKFMDDEPESAVIFLGDNIYPRGLHGKKSDYRAQDELRIIGQMDPVKDHQGEVIFIPGNHDWEQGGENGLKMIKRQQKFVEEYLGDDDNFMPDNGCPGPEVVEMGDVVMIVIDTQWWIHGHKKSVGEADKCDVLTTADFMVQFNEALKKNRNKHVIVVGHHPLKSNGNHGGRFTFKDHMFPLTNVKDKAYIPMPIIGSIYPLYRSILGDRQDIAHPVNTEMTNAILMAINEFDNVVYANGHEHNMQYFAERNNHLIVSGSGSKITHVGNSSDLGFGAERKGFAQVTYFKDGEVWLEYYGVDAEKKAELLFSKKLYQKDMIELVGENLSNPIDYSGKTKMVVGDSTYLAKGMKKFLMGSLNRELWLHPIEVPYLDMYKEKGGLKPIQVGGGMQSKSIRLEGEDGHQYVVRQIKKNTTFLVSKSLRNTIAQDAIYDGIAGSHPYAGIAIGRLSDPIGIYHTNPKLVYLPKDPILGDLSEEFGNTFCVFEERPHKDMSDFDSFGNSDKVMGYGDMIEKVHEKDNHFVDEKFALRSRLFDMIIGDWDRHDDQWRWASFKENGETLYRPIPRDRDQAFFKFNGLIPKITNRKWMIRKFQTFGPEIRDITGQNFNARYFDRSWLNQLDREAWHAEADFILKNLKDNDIDEAIELFPENAKAYNGAFLKSSLKSRRDNVKEIADRYYDVLAKSVKVVGKNGSDYFKVERINNDEVAVSVYPEKKDKPVVNERYYHRVFKRSETKEIILYGLDGKDIYHVTGDVGKSILIRIVGGEEDDKLIDESKVNGLRKKTKYYDSEDGNKIEKSKETRVVLKKEKDALQYERKDFIMDTFLPLPVVGYNIVDGIFVGAGISWISYGFDKEPYKSKQTALGSMALKTGAFNLGYQGQFTKVFGPFDFGVNAKAEFPFVFDYNGQGNETEIIELNERTVRMNKIEFQPFLALTNKSGSSSLQLSGHLNNYELDDDSDELNFGSDVIDIDDRFIGAGLTYSYVNVDDIVNPNRGVKLMASVERSEETDDEKDVDFSRIEGSLALYFPLNWMPLKTTLALRSGAAHVDGDFNFYQSAFIGGQKEFRGVARHRFAGNTSQFNNAELRIDLSKLRNNPAPVNLGLMVHGDLARVWLEDFEDSELWHSSIGGGVYFDLLNILTINATYSVSDDGNAFLIQGGFFF